MIVGVVLVAGAASGGVVTNPDGSINGQATLERSADLGGEKVGRTIDRGAEAVGRRRFGVGSSKILPLVRWARRRITAKHGPKIKSRYSSCWQRKS